MHTKFLSENVTRRDHFEDVYVDRMMIWEWILEK